MRKNNKTLVETPVIAKQIEAMIWTIRGQQVLLDRDLANLYGVETKRLNEQVRRNIERFPKRFRFQLSKEEFLELVANCDRFKSLKHSSAPAFVFTEEGVAMLSAVLHSEIAITVSIQIMDAFVAMRKFIAKNALVLKRLDQIELKQIETDQKFEKIFSKLEKRSTVSEEKIFFDGQIFDAYMFVCARIKEAKREIVLIDNYIDESILILFDKRSCGVSAKIFTEKMNEKLKLDIEKHNSQYAAISVEIYKRSHDRFLCIDDKVYHFGASLKDLGKKWFAVTLLKDCVPEELVDRINNTKL